MTNPDFGSTFTNNNYMPGIGQFSAVQQNHPAAVLTGDPTIIPSTALPSIVPVTVPVGGFTFTVPTQGSILTATLTQPRQAQGIYSWANAVHLRAPGTGTSWQHCVPFQATGNFGNNMVKTSVQGVSTLGKRSLSAADSSTTKSTPFANPLTDRLKRRSTGHIGSRSPSAKMFISEKKMLAHMRELRISAPPCLVDGINSAHPQTVSIQSPPLTSQADLNNSWSNLSDGWRKLQEIEDRLEISDEEEEDDKSVGKDSNLPHFYLDENISRQLRSTSNIIPKQILDDMNKPCMEIVLWKPPGLVKNEKEEKSPEETLQMSNGPVQQVPPSFRSVPTSSSNMDLDMFDNCDDEMQL